MKKFKVGVFGLMVIAAIGYVVINNGEGSEKDVPVTTLAYNLYPEEYKNPNWVLDNSDLIIVGKVRNIETPIKDKDETPDEKETVYEDSEVEISEILEDKSNYNFKIGDVVTVRVLGGTADNLTYETDSNDLLSEDKEVLLCLIDGKKDIKLPATDKQYFSIVGSIHGAFELENNYARSNKKSDIIVTRNKLNDSFKKEDLENYIKNK